jgi:hypothetical protein
LIDILLDSYKVQISKIALNPYPRSSIIYRDLIQVVDDHQKFLFVLSKKNKSNIIELLVNNIRFVYINRFIEEIFSFKEEVVSDMIKARIELDPFDIENINVN